MKRVTAIAYGRPYPQGSKRHIGNGRLIEMAGANLHKYRATIKEAAAREQATPTANPVSIHISFTFRRPQAHYKNEILRADAPTYPYPAKRGDIDKLSRSVLDAITGTWVEDDAQVIMLWATIRYDEHESTLIHMTELPQNQIMEQKK